MKIVINIVDYILGFSSYVMLPIIMFVLCMVIRLKIKDALKHCMTLGIGFIGIFMTFDFFVAKLSPVLECIIARTGINKTVLDVGWAPLAAMAWKFKLAPILIFVFLGINILMLLLKLTQVLNIDIWNYWHFMFVGQMVYLVSGNFILAFLASLLLYLIVQKLADWTALAVEDYSNLPQVAITTLTSLTYVPVGAMINNLIEKLPNLKNINGDPKHIKEKIGFFGESMFMGFIMGIILGIAAGYNLQMILELAFSIAAVVFILPRMSAILGEGLVPICNGVKVFLLKRFPQMKNISIGMDQAILMGDPAVVVTGILLMPFAVILALILPGVTFIPMGELPNIMGTTLMIVVMCNGNVFRAFLTGIPILVAKLYIASYMAPTFTEIASKTQVNVGTTTGDVTSFLDGGNILRYWILELFSGKMLAVLSIPVVFFFLYYTWKNSKNVSSNSAINEKTNY